MNKHLFDGRDQVHPVGSIIFLASLRDLNVWLMAEALQMHSCLKVFFTFVHVSLLLGICVWICPQSELLHLTCLNM